jgi:acylphosphatase
MKAYKFRITGIVQGVGFRWHTKRNADKSGVSGWVQNTTDWAVEGVVEGEDAAVEVFLNLLRLGPLTARVDEVALAETEVKGFDGFAIRH